MKIFHFGCWDLFGCHTDYVTNSIINDIIFKNDYDFGFISGDNIYNYYGIKSKKKTNYSIKKMTNAIECINKLDIPAFIALGNHDIDDDNCAMIELQMETPTLYPKVHRGWNMINNYYTVISNNNIFIVIDTNILDIKLLKNNTKAVDTTFKCYKKIKHNDNKDLTQLILEDYNEMYQMIADTNLDQYNNVIMIGHIPILSVKEKSKGNIINCISNNNHLFTELFDLFISKNIKKLYYVCADTHNFQHMVFKYKNLEIEQIISGTGGALLDTIKKCNITSLPSVIDDLYSFKLLDFNPNFGYTMMDIKQNNINIEFTPFSYDMNQEYLIGIEQSFD